MAGILQQAGETELIQDLLLINDEVSVREDQPASPIANARKTKATAKPSHSNREKTSNSSEGFLTNFLGNHNVPQEKKANTVTVKKYDRYKIKVKLFDQFPN